MDGQKVVGNPVHYLFVGNNRFDRLLGLVDEQITNLVFSQGCLPKTNISGFQGDGNLLAKRDRRINV